MAGTEISPCSGWNLSLCVRCWSWLSLQSFSLFPEHQAGAQHPLSGIKMCRECRSADEGWLLIPGVPGVKGDRLCAGASLQRGRVPRAQRIISFFTYKGGGKRPFLEVSSAEVQ